MRNKYFWAAAFWTIVITFCCLVSMKNFEGTAASVEGSDKYVHFTFYFVFTVLWFIFLKREKGNTAKTRFLVFILAFTFGLVIELCQEYLTDDRSADVYDVLANTSGSAGAILVLWLKGKFSNKK